MLRLLKSSRGFFLSYLKIKRLRNLDVPYYAFVIKSIEDYEMKLGYVLTDVFKNW